VPGLAGEVHLEAIGIVEADSPGASQFCRYPAAAGGWDVAERVS
jgi:hypothetical protein